MGQLNENGIAKLSTTLLWDSTGTAGTETVLYTVPTGKICVVTHVIFHTASASCKDAVITLGKSGGLCNEFRGVAGSGNEDVTLTNLDGTTKYAIVHQQMATRNTPDSSTLYTAGHEFAIEITTADADGGTATIDVFGYLFDA